MSDFESGLASQVRLLPGEQVRRSEGVSAPEVYGEKPAECAQRGAQTHRAVGEFDQIALGYEHVAEQYPEGSLGQWEALEDAATYRQLARTAEAWPADLIEPRTVCDECHVGSFEWDDYMVVGDGPVKTCRRHLTPGPGYVYEGKP